MLLVSVDFFMHLDRYKNSKVLNRVEMNYDCIVGYRETGDNSLW